MIRFVTSLGVFFLILCAIVVVVFQLARLFFGIWGEPALLQQVLTEPPGILILIGGAIILVLWIGKLKEKK